MNDLSRKHRILSDYVNRVVYQGADDLMDYILGHDEFEDIIEVVNDFVAYDLDEGEIYEYLIVAHHFGNSLQAQGELVVDVFDFSVWARTAKGSAIYTDPVVEKIARLLGILTDI